MTGSRNPPKEKSRFVSAEQVAQLAGVSRSAVSRSFTPGASVSPATREKVMQAAEALGYQVNDLARGLLANHSRLVGLVVTKPETGFRANLVAALAKALILRGSVPMLINTGQTDDELVAAQKMLFGYRAEATIILTGSPPTAFVELARRNGQPLVVIGRSEPDADHVRMGNAEASRRAASLFVANGYRRLGLVGSASGTPSVTEREDAFTAQARALGATVEASRGEDSDYAGGLAAGRQLLAGSERPQAIFCINDLLAFGVMDHARALGLAIPGDLAVIGFDDVPQAGWLSYRLTSFRQDPELMAARVVELIDRRQEGPDSPPIYERLMPELVIRSSFVPDNPA